MAGSFQLDLIVGQFFEAVIYYASLIRDVAMAGRDILDMNQMLVGIDGHQLFFLQSHPWQSRSG